jgi:hypothetical protein
LNQRRRVDDRNVDEVVDPLLEFINGCLIDGVMYFAIQKLAERSEELQIRMTPGDLLRVCLPPIFARHLSSLSQ